MTFLVARDGGECFIIGDSRTGAACVRTFDAEGINPWISTASLSRRVRSMHVGPRGFNGERQGYSVTEAIAELSLTTHYAELNDVHLYANQRKAWTLDPNQEWNA